MPKLIFLATLFLFSTCLCAEGLQEDIDRATRIVHEFKQIPENSIPDEVLNNCKGLAVLSVVKGGFVVSGRAGYGLVIAKTNSEWSAPSAIGVLGAGFGFQIGGEITDFIFVLNTKEAVDAFVHGTNVSLGGNVSIAAGPVGRSVEASVIPTAAIYAYSRSQGIFAGASLEGTVIVERTDANTEFYGKPVSVESLLFGKISPPSTAKPLYKELNQYLK